MSDTVTGLEAGTLIRVTTAESWPRAVGMYGMLVQDDGTSLPYQVRLFDKPDQSYSLRTVWVNDVEKVDLTSVDPDSYAGSEIPEAMLPPVGSKVLARIGSQTSVTRYAIGTVRHHDRHDPTLPISVLLEKFLQDGMDETAEDRVVSRDESENARYAWGWRLLDEDVTAESNAETDAALRREIQVLKAEKASLEARLIEDRSQYVEKSTVAEVAMRYARDNDWCDTVKDALREMGVDPPEEKVEFTLEVTITATGTPNRSPDDVYDQWVIDSIRSIDKTGGLDMDGDWEDVEVTDYSVNVSSITPYSD